MPRRRPRRSGTAPGSVLAAAAVWASVLAGCGDSTPAASAVSAGGTLVKSGNLLWLASADDERVVSLRPDTLAVRSSTDVGGAPSSVTPLSGGVLVTLSDRGELLRLRSDGTIEDRWTIPCGSSSSAAVRDVTESTAVVTCPFDAKVVELSVRDGRVVDEASVEGHPAAVVASDGSITVAIEHGGALASVPLDASLSDLDREAVRAAPGKGVSALDALTVGARGGVVAAYQVADNDTPRDPADPGDTGSYGALTDGIARIQPMIDGDCVGAAADFTRANGRASGVHALAFDEINQRVWVVGQYTGTVLVIPCRRDGSEAPPEVLASFTVEVGASGIVLSDDGRTAWVDLAFDHAVAELSFNERADLAAPSRMVGRETGDLALSDEALEGRRLFFDASDAHLTPSGVLSCASCHPDGGEDGLSWRIGTTNISQKLRRTPPLWGLSDGSKPFHWDGEFRRLDSLTLTTIRELLAGDGLLVQPSSISAWLAEIDPPPGAASDPEAVRRGAGLFTDPTVGCSSCHIVERSGRVGSDGKRHEVAPPSSDPDALVGGAITPILMGLGDRANFLHDGRVVTLRGLFDGGVGHGDVRGLSHEDVDALVAFVRSL